MPHPTRKLPWAFALAVTSLFLVPGIAAAQSRDRTAPSRAGLITRRGHDDIGPRTKA